MAGVYSIGSAARLLRVPPATIRTWEKRYGLVVPVRTAGGQRLYSHEQLEQLRFVVERIESGMRPGEAHRLLRERESQSFDLELPADAHAPAAARRAVEQIVDGLGEEARFNLRLLVSELVSNSVRHAAAREGATVRVRAWLGASHVHVEVDDEGPFAWNDHPPQPPSEGGRGLPLVAALAARWGLTFSGGTTAWFELPR